MLFFFLDTFLFLLILFFLLSMTTSSQSLFLRLPRTSGASKLLPTTAYFSPNDSPLIRFPKGLRKEAQPREALLREALFSTRGTSPSGKEVTRGYLPRTRSSLGCSSQAASAPPRTSLDVARPFMHVDQSLPVGGGHQAVH